MTYSPWSYSSFLDRLKTFNYATWPDCYTFSLLTPVDCANNGWKALQSPPKNTDNDNEKNNLATIQCSTCSKLQVFVFPDSDGFEDSDDCDSSIRLLLDKYKSSLVSQHVDSCPWKTRAMSSKSSPNIYYQRLQNPQSFSVVNDYESRLATLTARFFGSEDTHSHKSTQSEGRLEERQLLVLYAAMGWKAVDFSYTISKKDTPVYILECDACFRRILRSQLADYNQQDDGNDDDGDDKNNDDDSPTIDKVKKCLEKQHYTYCAYINQTDTSLDYKPYEKLLDLSKKDEKPNQSLTLNGEYAHCTRSVTADKNKMTDTKSTAISHYSPEYLDFFGNEAEKNEAYQRIMRIAKIRNIYKKQHRDKQNHTQPKVTK